jgi:hypothetical protein
MCRLILITGSRDATPAMLAKAWDVVRWCDAMGHSVIVGDASGVDAVVREACSQLQVKITVYGAYGKIRGPDYPTEHYCTMQCDYLARDREMAKDCDVCVGIWNGTSTGTAYTLRYARDKGKDVIVRTFTANPR